MRSFNGRVASVRTSVSENTLATKYPYCCIGFRSADSLEAISRKISHALFGGIPFGPVVNWDEIKGVELTYDVLGMTVYIKQSFKRPNSFWLEIESPDPNAAGTEKQAELVLYFDGPEEVAFPDRVNLNGYVQFLLKDIPGLDVATSGE